ncbi:sugar ABC transporter substrate-binding protein [Patulibacter sp. NPDC049589]|uniref:sugar ABC transporter substrate-binding protein n=1 Tax=Patulibacter sp. NPDC049589 TaxID=3154731 RepID=UPI00342A2FC1
MVVLGVVCLSGVTACGSDSDTKDEPDAPAATADAGASSKVVEDAKANLKTLLAPAKLEGDAPFKANSGKKLGVLNCGAAIPLCNVMVDNAKEAAAALGWTVVTVDGKLSPQGWNTGMKQLIAQKPDLILSNIAQDSAIPQPLAAAAKAKIPVACAYCANTFDKPVANPAQANADNDYRAQAQAAADTIIAQSDGKARVAVLSFNLNIAPRTRVEAFKKAMKKCAECEVVASEEIGATSDPAGKTRTITRAILSKFPAGDLDWIVSPADSYTVGVTQAVKLSRRDDVKVLGYDCNPDAAVDDVRTGASEGCIDSSVYPSVWAAIDQLARIDAGVPHKKLVPLPFQIVSKNNAPAAGKPVFSFDYKGYYKNLWKGE